MGAFVALGQIEHGQLAGVSGCLCGKSLAKAHQFFLGAYPDLVVAPGDLSKEQSQKSKQNAGQETLAAFENA